MTNILFVRRASRPSQCDGKLLSLFTNHIAQLGHSYGPSASQQQETRPLQDAVGEAVNTAKKDDLMSVQGIGNTTAKRIIKNRPCSSVDEVIEKEVVPEQTLDNVKTQLIEKTEDAA